MSDRLGAAIAITCPACGVGAVTGVCTLTRGEVETMFCDSCALYVRNGVVVARGVEIDPDDVREIGRMHAPLAPADALYTEPDARPVRLLARGPGILVEADPDERVITSLTIRFARPRPTP